MGKWTSKNLFPQTVQNQYAKQEKAAASKESPCKTKRTDLRVEDPEPEALPVALDGNRITRQSGPLHKKELCIWCMKPDNKKNTGDSFQQIQQLKAWVRFKAHTVSLKEDQMRDRILAVIAVTPDPFATEVYYHRSCWKKYTRQTYEDDNSLSIHVQNVRMTEVNEMFRPHVRTVILELNEPRTLRGLLLDYQNIAGNFGFSTEGLKTTQNQANVGKPVP